MWPKRSDSGIAPSYMAFCDSNVDTGGEFGVAGLFWQHGVQFLLSDGPMPTAGLHILAAQRNSPPVSAVVSSAAISIPSLIGGVVVGAGSTTSRYEHERKTPDLGFPPSTHWRQGFEVKELILETGQSAPEDEPLPGYSQRDIPSPFAHYRTLLRQSRPGENSD
jgi:hypothetical protein